MPNKVEDVIARALGISSDAVRGELEYGQISEWDSVAHIDLMLMLEATYGIEIDEDLVVSLTSVMAIREFLDRSSATCSVTSQ